MSGLTLFDGWPCATSCEKGALFFRTEDLRLRKDFEWKNQMLVSHTLRIVHITVGNLWLDRASCHKISPCPVS